MKCINFIMHNLHNFTKCIIFFIFGKKMWNKSCKAQSARFNGGGLALVRSKHCFLFCILYYFQNILQNLLKKVLKYNFLLVKKGKVAIKHHSPKGVAVVSLLRVPVLVAVPMWHSKWSGFAKKKPVKRRGSDSRRGPKPKLARSLLTDWWLNM